MIVIQEYPGENSQTKFSAHTINGIKAESWLAEGSEQTPSLPGGVRFVLDEDTELGQKIIGAGLLFEPVIENGSLVDIAPKERPVNLDEIKQAAILRTKQWVERELEAGAEFNGEIYSASKEKQDLLYNQLGLYAMNLQAEIPDVLTWNTKGGVGMERAYHDLLTLANALKAKAQPLVKKQQEAEIEINRAATAGEIEAVLEQFT